MENKRKAGIKNQMKIVLIFSPFVDPSYVPLGIAQLKSYVEQRLPFAKVLNLDLNNINFNNLAKKDFFNCYKNLYLAWAKKWRRQNSGTKKIFYSGKIYTLGINCLRDKKTRGFRDVALYNKLIRKAGLIFMHCSSFFSITVKDIIENERKIPKVLQNLLQEDINRTLKEKPDLIGFSVFSNEQLAYSLIMAKMLKKMVDLPIIFGGAAMAYIDSTEFLNMFDFVDFIIPREGEIGLTEVIKHLKRKNFENVPGLFYRKKNKIAHNNEQFIQNLDGLPFPDFDDFKLTRYFSPVPVLPINFSRGCFWRKCTFCTYNKRYPAPYKTKSIQRFIQELKYFRSRGINYFLIDDDAISARHLTLISNAIIKNRLDVFFGAITRPDKSFSLEVLKNIHRAGGRLLVWGIESSSQRILNLMKKGTTVKNIEYILKKSHEVGFHNHIFMIREFPTQTEKEICEDMIFLRKNMQYIGSFYTHHFILQRDSYIFNKPEEFGIKNFKENPIYKQKKKLLHGDSLFFKSNIKLDREKIRKKENEAFENLRNFSYTKFRSCCRAHKLIHASLKRQTRSMKN